MGEIWDEKWGLWSFLWSGASGCSPTGLVHARVWQQLRADGRGRLWFVSDMSMGKCSFVEIDTIYRIISLPAAEQPH